MTAIGRRVGRALEGALFLLVFIPLARHAPRLSRGLRPLFVWITWIALPARRRALRRTARVVLGPAPNEQALDGHGRRVLANLQAFIADVATIDRRSVHELAARTPRYEGIERVLPLLDERRAMILAGAHLGSFESSMAVLRSKSDVPVHVVYSRDSLRAFDRIRARARRHLGIVEQTVERGVETWLALREALERGEVVAILADRVLPGQRGAVLPLFGVPAQLPMGPVRLAAITGAPIVPTFSIPGADGLQTLRFEPPIHVAAADEAAESRAQRLLVDAIERAVRAAPAHWLVVDGPWIAAPTTTTLMTTAATDAAPRRVDPRAASDPRSVPL